MRLTDHREVRRGRRLVLATRPRSGTRPRRRTPARRTLVAGDLLATMQGMRQQAQCHLPLGLAPGSRPEGCRRGHGRDASACPRTSASASGSRHRRRSAPSGGRSRPSVRTPPASRRAARPGRRAGAVGGEDADPPLDRLGRATAALVEAGLERQLRERATETAVSSRSRSASVVAPWVEGANRHRRLRLLPCSSSRPTSGPRRGVNHLGARRHFNTSRVSRGPPPRSVPTVSPRPWSAAAPSSLRESTAQPVRGLCLMGDNRPRTS